jgi:hypothetical protein
VFSIDPTLLHIDAVREQVVAIIESVNQPHVAIPGKQPQPAQAWVAGVRNANASFSLYIYLFLAGAQEPVIYVYAQRQFALESYREVETDALNFVESMGFMRENVNFRNLAPESQDELLSRIPVFAPIESGEAAIEEAPEVSERGQRLARLLGAF